MGKLQASDGTWGPYDGHVDFVQDGDTVYVKAQTTQDIGFGITDTHDLYLKCRILEINAPEISTQEGKDAREFARSVLPVGTPVRVISVYWDKYGGRVDAHVIILDQTIIDRFGQNDFGMIMVTTGHAITKHY